MLNRYEREQDVVPNAINRALRAARESSRPTGTEINRTTDVAGYAKESAEQAAAEAATALTTADGKNSRRSGPTPPPVPDNGWAQGDQWVVTDDAGKPLQVMVWNGTDWVPEQIIANDVLVIGEGGVIQLADGVVNAPQLAADALNAKVIHNGQFYGGYIEAPVIASSDKLGSGANKLNDPAFTGAVNSAWVASGHLGDANATQRDTITWDQTWTMPNMLGTKTETYRNWGRAVADLLLSPAERKTGSTIFPNFSWLTKTARTVNNPYTFKSYPSYTIMHGQPAGYVDPTFQQVKARAAIAGTARTTYLTNTAVSAVKTGEKWNIRMSFDGVAAADLDLISAYVELINASNNTVLFTHTVSAEEFAAGSLNTWWDSTFTGNVKFRVKTVYKAGGGVASRTVTPDSYARGSRDGVAISSPPATPWLGTSDRTRLEYGRYPAVPSTSSFVDTGDAEYNRRIKLRWNLKTALFAQVQPTKGWRLTEPNGLELFNNLGEVTGKIDGQDNFLAGRLASAADGARTEIRGLELAWYDNTNAKRATINGLNNRMDIRAPLGVDIKDVSVEGRFYHNGYRQGLFQEGVISNKTVIDIFGLTGAKRYEITLILINNTTAGDLNGQLTSGGVLNSSAIYDRVTLVGSSSTAAAGYVTDKTSWEGLAGGQRSQKTIRVTLLNLNDQENTWADVVTNSWNADAFPQIANMGLRHRVAQAFDGMRFTVPTGVAVSGRYEVRAL